MNRDQQGEPRFARDQIHTASRQLLTEADLEERHRGVQAGGLGGLGLGGVRHLFRSCLGRGGRSGLACATAVHDRSAAADPAALAAVQSVAQIQTVATHATVADRSDFLTAARGSNPVATVEQTMASHRTVTAAASDHASATMAAVSSDSRFLTTDQSDPDDREEKQDT